MSTPEPDDRRARILEAALSEFADKGYAAASTNSIAEQAGVAKGLIFHHFGSKEDLFVAVGDDVIKTLSARFDEAMRDAPPELFARVMAWTDIKLRLMRDDPRRIRFFVGAFADAPEHVRTRARAHFEALMQGLLPRLVDGIDASRLKAGVSPDDLLEAIWTLSLGFERTALPLLQAAKGKRDQVLASLLERAKKLFGLLQVGAYDDDDDDDDDGDAPR